MSFVDVAVFERLVTEVEELRDRIDVKARSPQEAGVVTAVDLVESRVTVDVGGARSYADLTPGGVFIPKVGDEVTLWYSGAAVVVLPKGSSLFASHNFDPLDPGAAGWGMNAEGDLYANDGHFKGTVEASALLSNTLSGLGGDPALPNANAETAVSGTELLANGTFDTNTTGWTGTNCTLSRITATPTPQAGAGALRLAPIGTPGTMTAEYNTGTAGLAVDPTLGQMVVSCYYHDAPAVKTVRVGINFYDSAGVLVISKYDSAVTVTSAGTWRQLFAFGSPPPGAAFASPFFTVVSPAAAVNWHVDTVSVKQQVVGVSEPPSYVQEGDNLTTGLPIGLTRTSSSPIAGTWSFLAGQYQYLGYNMAVVPNAGYVFSAKVRRASGTGYLTTIVQQYTAAGVWISTEERQETRYDSAAGGSDFVVAIKTAPTAAWVYAGVLEAVPAIGILMEGATLTRETLIDGGYVDADFVRSQTYVEDASGPVILPGMFVWFPGDVPATSGVTDEPFEGYCFAAGQAMPRTGRSRRLFGSYGITHGAGDGSTTFNVPDVRGRSLFSADNSGGTDAGRLTIANTPGSTAGAEAVPLSIAELAAHVHGTALLNQLVAPAGFPNPSASGGGLDFTGSTGSGDAHYNMPPYMVGHWLIKM